MTKSYDAIIIGSGPDSLVAAAYLGKAGKRVVVLEARDTLGGTAITEEFHPGFRANTLVDGIQWLYPVIAGDLDLNRHGLEVVRPEATVFSPHPDGSALTLWRDPAQSTEAIRRHSAHDAERFATFNAAVTRLTRIMGTVYAMTPPDLINASLLDLMPFAQTALNLRGTGDRQLFESLRALPMPIFDWLNEWFESDLLKGTLAAAGIANLLQGPMSIGTAYTFFHHHVGLEEGVYRAASQVTGGMAKFAGALVSAAKAARVETRTGAAVEHILTNADGRVTGVALAGGEEIGAKAVISGLDIRQTFDKVDPREVDPVFLRRVRNVRQKGARARIHLALGELPQFNGADGVESLKGVISFSPDMKYLEWAFDDAKHGRISDKPYLEACIPTLNDPSLAPAGKHVMSISFQFAPYHLNGGWNKKAADSLLKIALDTLAQVSPNIKKIVEGSRTITPAEMEETYGVTEGHLYQGEMMLDQALIMRPVPGAAEYAMPVAGLWLCGPATHPGGALPGLNGYNAAREALKKL